MSRRIIKRIVWCMLFPLWFPLAIVALLDWAAGYDEEKP